MLNNDEETWTLNLTTFFFQINCTNKTLISHSIRLSIVLGNKL